MKFTPTIVAAVAAFSTLHTVVAVSSETLNAIMDSGKVDARKLMDGAKPINNGQQRKLEDIAADSVIQYGGCQTLTFDGSNQIAQLDEELQELAQYGGVIPVKSYVMFNVYPRIENNGDNGDNGDNGENQNQPKYDDPVTYLVDLPTYVQSVADFIPEYNEYFCENCVENRDYCKNYQDYDSYQDLAAAKDLDYFSCYECRKKGCFKQSNGYWARNDDAHVAGEYKQNDNGEEDGVWSYRRYNYYDYDQDGEEAENYNNYQQNYHAYQYNEGDEVEEWNRNQYRYNTTWEWHANSNIETESLEWLRQASACMQSKNQNFYIGMQCTSDGNLALGAYFDQDCTLFANQYPVGQFLRGTNNYAQHALSNMQAFAQSAAKCTDPMYLEWQSPENFYQDQYYNDGDQQDENNNNELPLSALCSTLMYGGGGEDDAALEMDQCNNNGYYAQNNFNEYGMPYDLSADAIENNYAVCSAVIGTLESGQYGWNGDWNAAYDGYDPDMISKLNHVGRKALVMWMLVLAAVVAGAFYYWKKKMNGGDSDKQEALIDEENEEEKPTGTLA